MLYLEYSHVCIWYSYKVDFFGVFPHLILRTVNNFHLKILAFYLGPPENLHMYVCLPVIGRKKAGISKYLACPTTPQNWMLSSSSYDNLSWAFTLPLLPNLRDSSTVYDSWKVEDLTTAALTLTRLFRVCIDDLFKDHHIRSQATEQFDTIFHYYPFFVLILSKK